MQQESGRIWAKRVFGGTELGDARWTKRLVRIAELAAERPGGKVTHVCRSSGDRQGAYDLLNSERFGAGELHAAVAASSVRAAAREEFVFVAVDGTSLRLTDRAGEKDFGAIGAREMGIRGLKVINALAVDPRGAAVGLLHQRWWSRSGEPTCGALPVEERESEEWVRTVSATSLLLEAVGARGWFQLDREGDSSRTLAALAMGGHYFTVRSAHGSRRLAGEERRRLRHVASRGEVRYRTTIRLARGQNGRRRTAEVVVRTSKVKLLLSEDAGLGRELDVNVVDVRESGQGRGHAPIHWRLLTNHPIERVTDVQQVVFGYQQRWRVEEFHKTWKSGACKVEETQLRTAEAVVKWATIMAAIATRIERLKHLHRHEPSRPAIDEFTKWEIEAAVLLRKKYKKRTDPTPTSQATVGELISWIADFGGYTGSKSSGGPPGAIVLRRGMEMLAPAAALLEQLAIDATM